jgi:hypothetical protein
MELSIILPALAAIKGCTFASLDAITSPVPGVKKTTIGEIVILFNSGTSGYERMVRRRLEAEGFDPSTFVVGDLPWGHRSDDLPSCVIVHNGRHYLQTIQLREGQSEYSIGGRTLSPDSPMLRRVPRTPILGLSADKAVVVNTYGIDSITRLKLLGRELWATSKS